MTKSHTKAISKSSLHFWAHHSSFPSLQQYKGTKESDKGTRAYGIISIRHSTLPLGILLYIVWNLPFFLGNFQHSGALFTHYKLHVSKQNISSSLNIKI